MNHEPAPFTRAHAAILAHQLRVWLLTWVVLFADALGETTTLARALRGQVHAALRDLERSMKATLVILAYARDPWPMGRRRHRPPFVAPRGFRRCERRGRALRHVTRGILPRGDLLTRVKCLRWLLAHPDRAVAHVRARIRRGLGNGRLAICVAPACIVRAAATPPTLGADTS